MRIPYRVVPKDGELSLTGPVRARVTVEAKHTTRSAGGDELHFEPVYSYTLDVPAGHTWKLPTDRVGPLTTLLGANDGVRVIVDPIPELRDLVPPVLGTRDIPCDLAVSELDEAACCVPRPCDPIPPGAMVAMPPDMPSLVTLPARGGLVRPRYFNGLFLTSAELAVQQRRLRAEQLLQNRAHGAGVVWGLVPVFDGQRISVGLGYGVDCCGNDLLVTTPYAVQADALFDDANKLFTRMHLLLEYVEVPEAPRPVHDECAPGITRAEPSRIRETVRLRLVPPRDFDGRGPIDDLLATGLIDSDQLAPQKDVPFDLWVRAGGATFDFPLRLEPDQIVLAGAAGGSDYETRTKPGWTMVAATVFFDDPNDPTPPAQIATLDPDAGTVKWHIARNNVQFWVDWRARRDGVRGTFSGTTRFDLFVEIDTQEERLSSRATEVTFAQDPPGPCFHEACDPEHARFPTEPPWLHGFPDAAELAADPRIMRLAASEFGLREADDLDEQTRDAIRDLAQAWCHSLLWPGPTCTSQAPHGIVIGCVKLDHGRIADVDAWGGRRWVMRSAMIDHVTRQIGMLPPDELVSRMAGLAGCAARQRVPDQPPPIVIERVDDTDPVGVRTARALDARTPALPPLLRTFAIRLAAAISRAIELRSLPGLEPPMIERLEAVGVKSVGVLLARDPEELLARLGNEHSVTLARVLASAEQRVDDVARVVGDALAATGADSRTTLDRAKLVKALVDALGVPAPVIEAAFEQALR